MAAVKVFLVFCAALAFVALELDAKTVPVKKVPAGINDKKKVEKPTNGGLKNITQQFLYPIYPGTKWCGAGNIATSYNDLGVHNTTDMCCRDHDNCADQISGWSSSSSYNLPNYSIFTKLSCSCDQAFYDCLKAVNNDVSSAVGTFYFNVLLYQPCFRQDYPIIGCKSFYPLTLRCKEYLFDTTKPKVYQYFDNPRY